MMPENSRVLNSEPFPIDEAELLHRYETLYTAVVYDVLMMEHGVYGVLPTNLKPLVDGMKVCGTAFTVKGMPDCTTAEEKSGEKGRPHERRAKMMEEMPKNSVVMWDSSHDFDNAQFGEMMTAACIMRGSLGAVVDGGIRDTDRIAETDYKIWYRYRTPASMYLRHEIVDWQIPVRIGDVKIFPGDVVFGDMDGIIVVPRNLAFEVLLSAEEKNKTERGWREAIASGIDPSEYVRKGGKF